jgi:hypothetical protein
MRPLVLPLLFVAAWASLRLPGLALSAFAPPKRTSPAAVSALAPRAGAVAKAENPPLPASGNTDGHTLEGSLYRLAGRPLGWSPLRVGTLLSPGDTLLVPQGAALTLRYLADESEVSIPGGGVYVVGKDTGLMRAFPRVFYHESEQASLATMRDSTQRRPSLARAIWLSQGKPPPPGALEPDVFRAKVPTRPVLVARPEGNVFLEAELFPIRQEIRLEETPSGAATLTGLLFGDDDGPTPVWSAPFGESPVLDVLIPRPGSYTFMAVSDDQARVSRGIRIVAQRTEPLP